MNNNTIFQSNAVRLATISLIMLFMVSAVAAESTERHKRSPSASGQKYSTNHRTAVRHRNPRHAQQGKRVSREDVASNHRNLRSARPGKRTFQAGYASNQRNGRQRHAEKRVSRTDRSSNRHGLRRDRDNGRYDRHESSHRYTYRYKRYPGFFSVFNNRSYFHNHRYNRYIPLTYHGHNYYYHNGAYYRYSGFGFSLVNNRIGIFLYSLPYGYSTLMIGGYPYYFAGRHYYIRDYVRNVYVQVDDPYRTSDWDDADNNTNGYQELIVYPKQGQSEEQMNQDEYECYLWAVDQTGFEPSLGKEGNIEDYQRAKSACLEGRGYVVN